MSFDFAGFPVATTYADYRGDALALARQASDAIAAGFPVKRITPLDAQAHNIKSESARFSEASARSKKAYSKSEPRRANARAVAWKNGA